MKRWDLLCAGGEIHGVPYRSFSDADDAQLVLDESPYTHCGPHRVEPGAGVAAVERGGVSLALVAFGLTLCLIAAVLFGGNR